MEWDFTIKNTIRIRTKRIMMSDSYFNFNKLFYQIIGVILLVFTVTVNVTHSIYLDCEDINNGRKCLCNRMDDGWRVECPAVSTSPITPVLLEVRGLSNGGDAVLAVKCSNDLATFQWELIQGVDLSYEKITAKVIKVEMEFCPLVDDGLKGFFNRVNISAEQLTNFSYYSHQNMLTFPNNFLEQLTNLLFLNLRNNGLQSLPDLSRFPNLRELNLRQNQLGNLPQNTFRNNQLLENIRLSSNNISSLVPELFPASTRYLDLTANRISLVTNATFRRLEKLNILILKNNPLDSLQPNCFDNMPELEELILDSAKTNVLPNFRNLPNLVILRMNYMNKFIPMDQNLSQKSKRMATESPLYINEPLRLTNLPMLSRLEVSYSGLKLLPEVSDVPNLMFINLQYNQISNLSSEFTGNLPALLSIDLSKNFISDLEEIKSPRLTLINLSQNKITRIPKDAFRQLGQLKELILRHNQISTVDYKAFESLTALIDLDLSHNQISFSQSPYANIKTADSIGIWSDLSPLHYCVGLRKINLAFNHIDKIYEDWRNSKTMLMSLDLSYNNFTQVYAVDFDFISLQLQLFLTHNQISNVDLENSNIYLYGKVSNISIYLDGNPLDCNCSAYKLKSFAMKSYRFYFNDLRCDSPENLKNLKLAEVPDKALICPIVGAAQGCPSQCDCYKRPVDKTIGVNCTNRDITNQNLPQADWKFGRGFQNWSIELDFSKNRISEITTKYIQGLPYSTNLIDLSENNLSSIAFLTSLSDNQNMSFSLQKNAFPCDSCSNFVLLWATHSQRIVDKNNISCLHNLKDNPESVLSEKLTTSIASLVDSCQPTLTAEIQTLIIVVAVLTGLCVILIFFIVRYAWILKAFLFSKGLGWCLFWDNNLDEEDEEKLYDAFVSYSHKDEEWVLEELVNRLEEKEGFKLCLHFRDWTPGDWIPDQIVRSVDQSKRTVVILSKNFVESVWSRLEFRAAHSQALSQSSNRVILVLIEDDLKDKDVKDEDLKVYMKMNTYLKKNDPWFWQKLKYALPHRKPPKQNTDAIKQIEQRERAIQLDKLRAKLEQTV